MSKKTYPDIDGRLIEMITKLDDQQKEDVFKYVESFQSERRHQERKKHFTEVNYADAERSGSGFITNISADGLYIEPEGTFAKGQKITLTFEHPSKEKYVKISGIIVRKGQKGFGVQFTKSIGSI